MRAEHVLRAEVLELEALRGRLEAIPEYIHAPRNNATYKKVAASLGRVNSALFTLRWVLMEYGAEPRSTDLWANELLKNKAARS